MRRSYQHCLRDGSHRQLHCLSLIPDILCSPGQDRAKYGTTVDLVNCFDDRKS